MAPRNVRQTADGKGVEVKHPDGSATSVIVDADGQISRTVTSQRPDGTQVMRSSDGAGVVIELRTYTDGNMHVEERHPDGTRVLADSRTTPDGSSLTVTEKQFPDGRTEISTDREETLKDGTVVSKRIGPDGTELTTQYPDGRIDTVQTLPGGLTKTASFVDTPDGWTLQYTDVDGSQRTTISSTDTATGWSTTTTTNPNGSVETEVERTLTYPDGRQVYEHKGPDGTATTRIEHADGSVDGMIVHPDGKTETSERVVYPDGRVMTETVNADGTRESTLTVPRPDGSSEITTNDVYGNTIHSVLGPDGSVDRQVHHSDGSGEHTSVGPEGYGSTTVTQPDGSTTVHDERPDPALQVDHPAVPSLEFDVLDTGLDELQPLVPDHLPQFDDDGGDPFAADSDAASDGSGFNEDDFRIVSAVNESDLADDVGDDDQVLDDGFDPGVSVPLYEPAIDDFSDEFAAPPVTELAVE